MLRAILDFLEDPDRFRTEANSIFISNELNRSQQLFDQIEKRPLTEEQRKAVVVDDDRNLVIAAAGSGKTSVIVAKAGWLLHRGYRCSSELLLLAFARDARKEMEERICKRLGEDTAQDITVSTFHSLGLAIIGKAEGRRPAITKVAQDDRAFIHLLKRIVSDLIADQEISETVLAWFREQFATVSQPTRVHDLGRVLRLHPPIRNPIAEGRASQELRGMRDCQLPLPQWHRV